MAIDFPTATLLLEPSGADISSFVTFVLTVTEQLPLLPLPSVAVAVIFTVPFPTPFTSPVDSSTVATPVLALFHLTLLFVAVEGRHEAVRVRFSPVYTVAAAGLTVTVATGSVTVTTHSFDLIPLSFETAVIFAVPPDFAVTTPLADTIATLSSLLSHVRDLSDG